MRKRILTVGTVLLCLALLAGCKFLTRTNVDFDTDSISKTQKIVICDAAGNEKAAITGEREIDAFVEAMDAERWKIEEVPEGLTEAGSLTLWQRETVTALIGRGETKTAPICTLQLYEGAAYLAIETGFMDVSIPFAIPEETAAYLRGLIE